jgi:hypothetical protein
LEATFLAVGFGSLESREVNSVTEVVKHTCKHSNLRCLHLQYKHYENNVNP